MVFLLNVFNGQLQQVVRELEREPVTGWVADRDGVVRFGYGLRERKGTYVVRDFLDQGWRLLARFDLSAVEFAPLGFGITPNTMLVSKLHNGRDAVFEMDLADKSDYETDRPQIE